MASRLFLRPSNQHAFRKTYEEEGNMRRLFLGLALVALAAGVPAVAAAGDLETAGQSGNSNLVIARQIADNMRTSGQLKGFSIGVLYQNGEATLDGKVTSQQQRQAAIGIAQQCQGVTRVIDRLTIAGPTGTPAINASMQSGMAPGPMPSPVAPGVQGMPPQMMQSGPNGQPIPAYMPGIGGGQIAPVHYNHANLPQHAWPAYASYPNYAGVTYPKQYSPTAWPFIGPFYPYPQVPLGWRKVTLEWDDGWWMLDFKSRRH
jgi:hypothetical protein